MRTICAALMLILGSTSLLAQYEERKSPEEIEQELQTAERNFEKAKKMFNPWYTGPIQTGGASMMPPGWGNIQPYLYVTDFYAQYDSERHSHDLKSSKVNVNPTVSVQFGVSPSMDITLGMQANANWQFHHSGAGFGDMNLTAGFPLWRETLHIPGVKLAIKQIFPTGQYKDLNTNGLGLSATGAGSYATQFTLALQKIIFWDYLHPVNFRTSFSYLLSTPVHVRGFNTYGGGFDTHATVHPGNALSADVGVEVSLTQHWVIATDIVYSAQNRTGYSGNPGTNADGSSASLGGGYSDNLNLSPAIEYNWNENLGMLGGVWFSVYGRNSGNFVSGVLSVVWTFKVN